MDTNSNDHTDSFSAAFPLPSDDKHELDQKEKQAKANPAADLIRKKVEAAFENEPDAQEESEDLEEVGAGIKPSTHQQFILQLTSSGKPLADIQVAWHEYYAGLSDIQKHQVWQEFYSAHAAASNSQPSTPSMAPAQVVEKKPSITPKQVAARQVKTKKINPWEDLAGNASTKFKSVSLSKARQRLKSLFFGIGVGCVVILILLFSFFNERFIAPFIQPSRNVSGTPIINASAAVSSAPEVIIPKINVEDPVVYGVDTIDDNAIQTALESGAVHYADTAQPGQNGNLVIVGHSSGNIFSSGQYKFAFVLLNRLVVGDTFYLQKDGKRYTYQVYLREIVKPDDVSVLGPRDKPATATLITCDPPGLNVNRLVVVGEQIDPSPIANTAASTQNTLATSTKVVPGNSISLWSRIIHAL